MPDGGSASLRRPLWHVSAAGWLYGPLDEAGLRGLAARGQLTPYTLVRREGTPQWRLAAAVPEVAALAATQAATPAPTKRRWLTSRRRSILVIALGVFLAGYWAWRFGWIGPDLFELLPGASPRLAGRHVTAERRIKLPPGYGLYAIAGGKTVPCISNRVPASFGPQVEFLYYGPADGAARYSTLTQLGPGGKKDGLAAIRQVSTVGRCLHRQPRATQFVPAESLKPGLYRLGPEFSFAVGRDSYRRQLADQATAAYRERRWPEGQGAERMYLAVADGSTSEAQSLLEQWSELSLTALAAEKDPPTTRTIEALEACLKRSPAMKSRVAEVCLARAKNALAARPIEPSPIEALFKLAKEASPDSESKIAPLLWTGLARALADPPALGRDAFTRLWPQCDYDWLTDAMVEQPAWSLAQALFVYDQGRRTEILPLFQQLTGANDPAVAKVAHGLMDSPKPGRPEIRRAPIVFRNPRGRSLLKIELASLQVGGQEIELNLRVSNPSLHRQELLFAAAADSRAFGSEQPLSMVDDIGQRLPSRDGLVGGKHVSASGGNLACTPDRGGRTGGSHRPLPHGQPRRDAGQICLPPLPRSTVVGVGRSAGQGGAIRAVAARLATIGCQSRDNIYGADGGQAGGDRSAFRGDSDIGHSGCRPSGPAPATRCGYGPTQGDSRAESDCGGGQRISSRQRRARGGRSSGCRVGRPEKGTG